MKFTVFSRKFQAEIIDKITHKNWYKDAVDKCSRAAHINWTDVFIEMAFFAVRCYLRNWGFEFLQIFKSFGKNTSKNNYGLYLRDFEK